MSNLLSISVSAIVLFLLAELVAPFVQNVPDIIGADPAVSFAVYDANRCQPAATHASDALQMKHSVFRTLAFFNAEFLFKFLQNLVISL